MNIYTIVSIGLILLVLYLIYSRKSIWENFEDAVPDWFSKRAYVDVVTPGYNKLISMPNLQLWLDGSNTSDITTSGTFKWLDRSKNARAALVYKSGQPAPTLDYKGVKLTYNSSVNNGLYVSIPPGTFSKGATVFVVAKKTIQTSPSQYETLFSRCNGQFAKPFDLYGSNRIFGSSPYKDNTSNFNISSPGFDKIFVSSHLITPTSWKEYLNDNQVMDFSYSIIFEDGVDKFYIGTRADSYTGFNGIIYDVLVFSGTLSAEDYNYVMNYLMIKWNINQNYSDLYGSKDSLQKQLTDANGKLNTCNTTSTGLQKQVTDISNNLNSCKISSASLQTQLNDANNKFNTCNTTSTLLQKQVNDISNNLNTCKISSAGLQTQLNDANGKFNTCNTTSTGLQKQVTDISNNWNACKISSSALQTQITDISNNWNACKISSSALQTQVTDISNNWNSCKISSTGLQTQLNDANNNLNTWKNKASTLQTQLTDICTNFLTVQSQLTESNNKYNTCDANTKNYLAKIYDLSQGLFDCQGNFIQTKTTVDNLNLEIKQLNDQILKIQSPSPYPASTVNCNYITICKMKYKSNFNYEQVGCTDINPLTQLVQTVKDLNEAIDLSRIYGATVFALTGKNELYIGFSYDTKRITSTNLCEAQQTIKVYCAIPTVQTTPTFYGYPYYCSYKSNSTNNPLSTDFKNIISTTFNNMDSKYNMGKVNTFEEAKIIANKYGATAFFIDVNSNIWITYNFNKVLIDPTVKSKSKSSSIKETIYFAELRTYKIQLSHPNCA